VLIKTNNIEEIEALEKDINTKCKGKLEANAHKLRNPRLVIINIPQEISIGNLEDTLRAQNTDVNLKQGDINAKFCYETRKHTRNLVMEVSAQIRKLLLHKKIKLGWQICKIEDYVVATRCYKCSRFNHRARDCRGEETCPLCAGNHKLKECKLILRNKNALTVSVTKTLSGYPNLRKPHFTGQELPKLARDFR